MSHASSSKVCKYGAFLSFRGPDTRKNFVSHLYNALEQRGIDAFKDDERLETEKSISNELLKAIEESRFSIVIFSKSYASSRWCLEELAHIIKCRNELDQIVIPIFYDVSPYDVSHQNSPFAESFSQHEEKHKDDLEKVQRWREACKQAGKISGYHLQVQVRFLSFVFSVLFVFLDLFFILYHILFSSSYLNPMTFVPLEYGEWAVLGRQKLQVLYMRDHQFEAYCFLDDVGEMCRKKGLKWLQKTLICKLFGKKMNVTSECDGTIIIKNGLRWKKVLLILDNVDHLCQLEFIVGGTEWFGRGSRILITTRDKHLITTHVKEDKVYEVLLLSETEALELFCMHAFKRKSPERDFAELSSEVVKYADGLPLALKVLGSSVYGRNKEHCRQIIDRLKKIPNDDILGKLKIGLDGLNKDEMRIFLDIACLYNHRSRDDVERILKSCSIDLIGINYLIEKSLLSIRGGYRFEMHNLIRGMGENVSREEYANSRIWLSEEVHDLFTGKLKPKKVESLCIPKGYRFEDDHVNHSKVFKRMQNLQVLILGHETICSDSAITYLPSSLRCLEWPNYPSSSLPEGFEPSHLVSLRLFRGRVVELWSISKKLSNLKHLELSESLGLTKTPNFGDMPNLDTLILQGCNNLEEVHPSLGHCRMLTKLYLINCGKLKNLPKLELSNLKHLILSQCGRLTETPNFGDKPNLETLILQGCKNLEEVHPSLGHCRMLTKLYLTNCGKLKKFPKLGLSNLKHFILSRCGRLTETPNFGDKPNLETLYIFESENLEEVHPSLGHCRMLNFLHLWGCEKLKKLPNFVTMESLETLHLFRCTSLEEFPKICGDMRRLSTLCVESPWIRSLPPSLSNLGHLELKNCKVIGSIPDTIRNLKYLSIEGCSKLATLPNSLFESGQLEEIHINKCSELEELPISLGVQKKLVELVLKGCENLKKLPSSIQAESPRELEISNCPKLDTFPEINGDMHSLKELTIKSTGIRELPSSIGNLSGLTELYLKGCEDLVSLPNSLCNLKNLRSLILLGCRKLEKLPEKMGDLQALRTLDASETAINQPPPSITSLGNLTKLCFSHQQQVQHSSSFVLHQVSGLSSLIELDLSNRNILGGLPEDLGSLQSLECLDVSGSNISCLPKSIKELSQLKTLDVQFCQNLNELPGELPPNLKALRADYLLDSKSIRDLINQCLKLCYLQISWGGYENSECQVNVLKSLQHLTRTCIQYCDFHQRDYFSIFFPEVRIPESFRYELTNQEKISINLIPSSYTDKFTGNEVCSGIRLSMAKEAVNNAKSRALSDSAKRYYSKTEIGCSMILEQPEPSLASSSQASADHDIAIDRGLYLEYENKALEVDQAGVAVQNESEPQNVELIRELGSIYPIRHSKQRRHNDQSQMPGAM
ncbi:TMV resistance protein N-like [Lycium ferocissimum]|uniref:TMV resistance protein N-like n=1 Tax=Lycium ferocissimum TaxID=112874 RepID=UPI0028154891|nr:TMV resistance protein N-like [Lycium ferocissimum]